jgi:hypothetical protein
MRTLTIQLPDEVYARLQHAAHGNEKRVRQVAIQMLSAVPPPDDTLPQGIQQELRVLESLSDDVLWAVARSKMAASKQRRWKRLLDKNRQGTLTESEQQDLEQLTAEGDRLTLSKAHAYLLLKERGHRIPALERLQRQG